MDQLNALKQMMDFNKSTFDNSFNAMVMVQEQTGKMAEALLAQAGWLPEEGKKAISEWVNAYEKGREDFKKAIDDNYKKVEEFFPNFEKQDKGKAK